MKSDFKEGRRGYAFKNGKLYSFEPRHVLVMTIWPDPRAWFKRRSHNWRPTRKLADKLLSTNLYRAGAIGVDVPDTDPLGQRLLPGIYAETEHCLVQNWRRDMKVMGGCFDMIPADIRNELLKYSERKWHLLNMFARCPGAMDLSHSNPALLYALASNWVFHKPAVQKPVRAARSLMSRKQKHILSWLGFPATETARKILSKIMPRSLSINALLYLRDSFNSPEVVKMLSHVNRINAGILRLATDARYRQFITSRLLEDLAEDDTQDAAQPPISAFFEYTLRMMDKVPGHHVRKFVSLDRLRAVHDELAARVPPALMEEYRMPFPSSFFDPPFAGTEDIQPLTTPRALYFEGEIMDHCAGSYTEMVTRGSHYIYRVASPVRATLSIYRCGKNWRAGQLYMAHNKRVDAPMREYLFTELFRSGQPQPSPSWYGWGWEMGEWMDGIYPRPYFLFPHFIFNNH
ncbi:MAG TPA: hypothetical protein PKM67_03890 [Kiritimatiellia bacterium]|nr:hypothetical protein [Kiritimatiellia bacterium]HNS80578.1 hypothetical protein [Kiritimatiellia bacterium]